MIRHWLSLPVVMFAGMGLWAQPVPLHCWVVRTGRGESLWNGDEITNQVAQVNKFFSQVAMSFEIASLNFTNDEHYAEISIDNPAQYLSLYNVTNNTGGLEVYFVNKVLGGAVGFYLPSNGVVVGRVNAVSTTLAHEIGHACGLSDIYTDVDETPLAVSGNPLPSRFTHDWGWYPHYMTQADVIRRLLMFGFNSDTKGDISRGDIYGLWYTNVLNAAGTRYDKVWQLGNAPVGFKLHGNRHPVSE